jgi:cytochrome c551/c552
MNRPSSRKGFLGIGTSIVGLSLLASLGVTLLTGCPQSSDQNTQPSDQNTQASAGSSTQASPPASAASSATAGGADGKGIGPVTSVEVPATVDAAMAAEGKKLFDAKCSACHKIEAKYVGPALQDVTKRRKPEWIMNMILNPSGMTAQDPTAKELFSKFLIQMADQHLDQKQARTVLEFFRSNDTKAAK